MIAQNHESIIRDLAEQVYNLGNVAACDGVYHPNATIHNPNFPVDGVRGLKEQARELRQAYPDLNFDVENVVVATQPDSTDGNYTCTRYTLNGTAQGQFQSLPATGRSFAITGMTMSHWEDDRIAEEWVNLDLTGLLQQTGVLGDALAPGAHQHLATQETRHPQSQR